MPSHLHVQPRRFVLAELRHALASYAALSTHWKECVDRTGRLGSEDRNAGQRREMNVLEALLVFVLMNFSSCYIGPSVRFGGRLDAFDIVYGQVTKTFEITNQKVRLTNEAL